MHQPLKPHMDVVECILRYLKFVLGKGLFCSKHGHLRVESYINVDWVGLANNRRST